MSTRNDFRRPELLVVDGNTCLVNVEEGHLRVQIDGQISRHHPATKPFTRMVVLAPAGSVTVAALRWLEEAGIPLTMIDRDGTMLLSPAETFWHDDARLRRAQAMAPWTGAAMTVARWTMHAKASAQARTLSMVGVEMPHQWTAEIDAATGVAELRITEAASARWYWQALAGVPVAWKSERRVPEHWHSFGGRHSPLSRVRTTARHAATPAHAAVNFLGACVKAEAIVALRALGLDPGMGVMHGDEQQSPSLALDVMEVVRPAVDAIVLGMALGGPWERRWFTERSSGEVAMADSRSMVADHLPSLSAQLYPACEEVRRLFAEAIPLVPGQVGTRPMAVSTPLTGAARSEGRKLARERRKLATPAA